MTAMRRSLVTFTPFTFGVIVIKLFLQALADANGDAVTILNQREELVEEIAGFAQGNYENREALVATCGISSNCSRRVCAPLTSDEFRCHEVPNNPDCIGSNDGVCGSAPFSWPQSFINWSNDSKIVSPTCDMRTTICTQRLLDSQIFTKSELINRSWEYTGSNFFCSPNGIVRSYPGKEWSSNRCTNFNARSRPWYVGSTAIKKDVVLLLDYGPSMLELSSLDQSNDLTIFNTVQIMVARFIDTLTRGDRVSIMTLADTANVVQNLTALSSAPQSLGDPTFEGIKTRVRALRAPDVNGKPANVTEGLNQAALLFDNPKQLRVVILITSGQVEGEYLDQPLVDDLRNQKVVPFVFRLLSSSQNDRKSEILRNLSTTVGGAYEEALFEDQNPLANLDRYYSYVAWLRFNQDGQRPFWVRRYLSYSGTTNTTSVVFPAFSNKILIGLVVVEILVDYLGELTIDVDGLLSTRNTLQYLELNSSTDVSIPPNETSVLNATNSCPFQSTNVTGLCDNLDSKTSATDLLCCKDFCSWQASHGRGHGWSQGKLLGVLIGSAGGLVTLMLIFSLYWLRKRARTRQREKIVVRRVSTAEKHDDGF